MIREHEDVLRFWFDRGVAGIRIDSAALPVKDPALPLLPDPAIGHGPGEHPHTDRDELHDIYRGWRAVADSYPGSRALVGEIWLEDTARFARYLRPDEMHTAFNFDFMARAWSASEFRSSIDATLAAHEPVGAPATWVLSNHDVTRPVTRYGREDSSFAFTAKRFGTPTDLDLGTRRARAALLLVAALPGSLYIYQGDELGLPEAELPRGVLQDPMYFRSEGIDPGREGCRVPLPWAAPSTDLPDGGTNLGFSPPDSAAAWLPQPAQWATLAVDVQTSDAASMLSLYRRTLELRRAEPSLVSEALHWLPSREDVLAFRRGDLLCLVNLGSDPAPLPADAELLLASDAVGKDLPGDTAAWLRMPHLSTSPLPTH